MAPAATSNPSDRDRVGPHPSYIEVAKPYILQASIQRCLSELNMVEAKEDLLRLQGITYIDNVRRALQLPVRTFNTAAVYYHKFRLLHPDSEYNWADASAAALFTACKIEDTLKKSREILCANWNLGKTSAEHLSPDDPRFENHSKLILGLERLMLESAGFDFRNRYPQKLVVKLSKAVGFDKGIEGKTVWNLSMDLYRTWAVLKQSTTTMAVACVELAARLHGKAGEEFVDKGAMDYKKWNTSRAEVMETLLDLLDLYTHHRTSTSVGPEYTLETFIDVRIALNNEASAANIPRFAPYESDNPSSAFNGSGLRPRNGIDPPTPLTPATPGTISPGTAAPPTSAIGIRGQNGTVRFMLDAARARHERAEFDKYHKIEEEEYEVEVPNVPTGPEPDRRTRDGTTVSYYNGAGRKRGRGGRGGRGNGSGRAGRPNNRAQKGTKRAAHAPSVAKDSENIVDNWNSSDHDNDKPTNGASRGERGRESRRGRRSNRGRGRGNDRGHLKLEMLGKHRVERG